MELTYPISKYIEKDGKGKWIYVKTFKGNYNEALVETDRLQKEDTEEAMYRIWDCR